MKNTTNNYMEELIKLQKGEEEKNKKLKITFACFGTFCMIVSLLFIITGVVSNNFIFILKSALVFAAALVTTILIHKLT